MLNPCRTRLACTRSCAAALRCTCSKRISDGSGRSFRAPIFLGRRTRRHKKQKKSEEDLREQQELVATLQLDCELEAESDEGEAEY